MASLNGQGEIKTGFMNLARRKQELRVRLRAELSQLSQAERERASRDACELLDKQPVWQKARSILCYSPLALELDIRPLVKRALEEEKQVFLPRFDPETNAYCAVRIACAEKDTVPGKYGILEPAPECECLPGNRLDFILVPGLGFDASGRRLGRGKGYYDRLLKALSGVKCGLAFDCQVCDEIPAAPHDETVNYLLTPTRWLAI